MSFTPHRPCRTRCGFDVRIFATNVRSDYPISGAVLRPDGSEVHCNWTAEGKEQFGIDAPMIFDLVNVSDERSGWMNIYEDGTARLHHSREMADQMAGMLRVACIGLSFTKGAGL